MAPVIEGLTDLEEIGRGGFGTVYRAYQPAFRRDVAVKVITGARLDAGTQARFERECQATGALSGHPNIIAVYGAGITETGDPYFVMDFHSGGSLADRVDEHGPLDPEQVITVGIGLAGALETAHRAGILHRDVKPENVLYSGFGHAVLVDFGIARVREAFETGSGVISATLVHAAPEIVDGAPASPASDVYSLSSTLFFALTGTSPFFREGEETIVPLLSRIVSAPPPDLRSWDVPEPMAMVIAAGLAKDPGDRPASGLALATLLQDVARQIDIVPPTVPVPIVVPIETDLDTVQRAHDPSIPVTPPAPPMGSVAEEPSAPAGARQESRRRGGPRVAVAIVAAAVVLMALALAALAMRGPTEDTVVMDDESPEPTVLEREDGLLEFAFAAVTVGGVQSERTWQLDTDSGLLTNLLVLESEASEPTPTQHIEVIPKEVAPTVGDLRFDPEPTAVIEEDPVVAYDLVLQPGERITIRWEAAVGEEHRTADGLASLAGVRDLAEAAFVGDRSGSEGDDSEGDDVEGGDDEVAGPATTQTTTGQTTSDPGPAITTTTTASPATTTTTTTTVSVTPPGQVASFVVRDPVPLNNAEQSRVTLQWSPPTSTGGEAPTRYRIRCTLMRDGVVYTGTEEPAPCKGGVILANVSGTTTSTNLTVDRIQTDKSWLRWEIAAENSAGAGTFRRADTIVPDLVGPDPGFYSWEAWVMGRSVGLNVGGAPAIDCGRAQYKICSQSIGAGQTRLDGTIISVAEQS